MIPLDPFDGKPMRNKKTDRGMVFYSIGPDITHDGAPLDETKRATLDLRARCRVAEEVGRTAIYNMRTIPQTARQEPGGGDFLFGRADAASKRFARRDLSIARS